jgi:hypothetical protein
LVITAVRFGTSSFPTDRGTRALPAWLFSFEGVQNPAAVLAVTASSQFPAPPGSLDLLRVGARVSANGRSAVITFAGARAGKGPCTADYTVDQLASSTAVAVRVRETRQARGGPCLAIGYPRSERVEFASPLGNRVLVDASTRAPVATAT